MSELRRQAEALHAAGFQPKTVRLHKKKPKRPDFKADVKPFASGWGWSAFFFVGGMFLLVVSFFLAVEWIDEWDWLFLLAGLGAGAVGYGLGYGAQLYWLKESYMDRLWTLEDDSAEFAVETPHRYYLKTEPGIRTKMPDEPRAGALIEFISAILDGSANLSEADARLFDYKRRSWVSLRDYLIKKNIAHWRDAGNHNAGVELNAVGGTEALSGILDSYYEEQK
jgi:hypothetical protein